MPNESKTSFVTLICIGYPSPCTDDRRRRALEDAKRKVGATALRAESVWPGPGPRPMALQRRLAYWGTEPSKADALGVRNRAWSTQAVGR